VARRLTRLAVLAGATALGCATSGALPQEQVREADALLVPAGFGSLRQEDIVLRLQLLGLQVQAIPLDETVIRVLSPDTYRTLRELVNSQRPALDAIARRTALGSFSLWDVRFNGLQQGETPFSPMEFIVTSVGRDFRPIEVIPLTGGFGRQRLAQRETQRAIYVFDPQVDVNQPLIVQFQTARSTDWTTILTRIERERALVRSRSAGRPPGQQ
jgi:hypothetical protein